MFEFLENGLGLTVVNFLQQGWWGEILWYLLYPFHFIGSEMGFLILMPIIYWSVHKSAGKRLFILALSGAIISSSLKGWWQRPRPFQVAPDQIDSIATTTEPGLPSGHTIFGTIVGLWILHYFRNRKVTLYMILFIVLMGLSRMVHGMHYPQDVVLGWLVGALIFWIYVSTEPFIVRWFRKDPFLKGTLLSLVLWIVGFTLTVFLGEEYESQKSVLAPLGALVGGAGGIFFEERFVGIAPPRKLRVRVIRGITGIVLLVGIYMLLNLGYYGIFEGNHSTPALAFYSLRYVLLGFTVTWFIPWIFQRLKL